MKKIVHVIDIMAPRKTVFEAVYTTQGLANWWTSRVAMEDRPNPMMHITFEDMNLNMTVAEAVKDDRVDWQINDGDTAWAASSIYFEILDEASDDRKSRLMFVQLFEDELEEDLYGIYNHQWGHYLDSLKAYCETGVPDPYYG